MNKKISGLTSLVMLTIFTLMGVWMTWTGAWATYLYIKVFHSSPGITKGSVVNIQRHITSGHCGWCVNDFLTIKFNSDAGKTYLLTEDTRADYYKIGDTIIVYYAKENPNLSTTSGDDGTRNLYIISFILGAGYLLIPIFYGPKTVKSALHRIRSK